MAHASGPEVDGAHAFGHFDYKIPDLGGDYYGASLHKWLGCPLGTGLLYVRRDRIASLWPVFGDNRDLADTDIMKLNHTGTHPVHSDLAIEAAMAFHDSIGTERKEARLRTCRTTGRASPRDEERHSQYALRSERSCAIATSASRA